MQAEETFRQWKTGQAEACGAMWDHLWTKLSPALMGYARYAGGDVWRVMHDAFGSTMMTFDQIISGGECQHVLLEKYQEAILSVFPATSGVVLNDYHDGLSWISPMITWPGEEAFETAFLTCYGDKCRVHRYWDIMA